MMFVLGLKKLISVIYEKMLYWDVYIYISKTKRNIDTIWPWTTIYIPIFYIIYIYEI